jgi:cytochrome c peroxidase
VLLIASTSTSAQAEFVTPSHFGSPNVPAENPLSQDAFELGRRLFYDPVLSGSNLVSCASCHIQRLAFTDGVAKSSGSYGMELEFNSMSLANLMWGPQLFFWNGRVSSLEDQALAALVSIEEMDQELGELVAELRAIPDYRRRFRYVYGELTSQAVARGLASFMRMLVTDQSKYDGYLRGVTLLSEQEEQGRLLFMSGDNTQSATPGANCASCHSLVPHSRSETITQRFRNNGLDDAEGLSKGLMESTGNPAHRGVFKTPTLRNIEVTAPYMHDGRFNNLHEVIEHYNRGVKQSPTLDPVLIDPGGPTGANRHPIKLGLGDEEVDALVAFLKTLTDEKFLTDTRFSNPFSQAD